jgi:hypothetical protein
LSCAGMLWACRCTKFRHIRHINPYLERTLTPNTSTQLAHQSTSNQPTCRWGKESQSFVLCSYALGLLLYTNQGLNPVPCSETTHATQNAMRQSAHLQLGNESQSFVLCSYAWGLLLHKIKQTEPCSEIAHATQDMIKPISPPATRKGVPVVCPVQVCLGPVAPQGLDTSTPILKKH